VFVLALAVIVIFFGIGVILWRRIGINRSRIAVLALESPFNVTEYVEASGFGGSDAFFACWLLGECIIQPIHSILTSY
jgi:hypothetical protein